MSDMSDRLEIDRQGAVLRLAGEVDAHSAPMPAAQLDPLPAGGADVVLEISGIEFMDSSGLRVMIEAHDRAVAEGRRLVLRAPSPAVRRLLEVSGLSGHLMID